MLEIGKKNEMEQKKSIYKQNKKSIYFAHPIDTWQTVDEFIIEKRLKELCYDVVNPFVEEKKLNEKYGVTNYIEDPSESFAGDIVDEDYKMVARCDEYFGWFPKGITMIGTPIELTWAKDLKKPITVLCHKPHPFLIKYYDNKFYLSIKDFLVGKEYKIKP